MPAEEVTRKLRAILSADAKGYSLLMTDDEAFTVKTLKAYRTVMSAQIVRNKGRVVDAPGDNLLAEFASVVDAVQCAAEIQKKLKEKNEALANDRRLEFRIGVNIGDVIQDGDRLYGEGVNIAARIEGLAEAGGVCISRNAYNHIRNKLNYGYENLGEHSVKNIKDPVRVYKVLLAPNDAGKLIGEKKYISKLKLALIALAALLIITTGVSGGLYWKYLYLPEPTAIDPENKIAFDLPKGPSIAVLPFDNMTGDPGEDSFCDGLTEILISTLSYVQELLVIARNSSLAYRGKQLDLQQIGKELNADWIIEGSVQKAEEQIRITVQLIDATSGHHKWSETYDRKFNNIFQLQDEIVQKIVKAIGEELVWGGAGRNALDGVKSIKELTLLAKAISNWSLETIEGTHNAQEILLELIDMNPSIPMAHVVLSSTYIQNIWFDKCPSTAVCLTKAFAASKRAFALNKNFDYAHVTAGHLNLMIGDHEQAINYYESAIALNPNNAYAYSFLGEALIFYAQPEKAIAFLNKAMSLNPKPYHNFYHVLGFAYQDMGEFEKAIESYTKCLRLNPDNVFTYIGLVIVYGHMENEEKANQAKDELLRLNPNFTVNGFLETMPYKFESSRSFLRDGFQKAGLEIDG